MNAMSERPNMVRETLAALGAGAVLLAAWGATSALPQDTALQTATVWALWMLAFSVAVLVWRMVARRR